MMKPHYVYIIQNESGKLYKGYSQDLEQRVRYHNENRSTYTSNKGLWQLVFKKTFEEKSEALKFEKMLKKQNTKYLLWLIDSDKNEL